MALQSVRPSLDTVPTLITFLSPFDNLIWDRQRVLDRFSFDYRAEMYQPAVLGPLLLKRV